MDLSASWQTSPRRMIRDVLLVARGTVIGQAPFVLVTPLITRLFPATELGIYGVALAFIGIAAPVAGLRFELAVISARNEQDVRPLAQLAALAALPVTLVSVAILGALKSASVGPYGALTWPLVLMSGATIAAAGLYSTLRCWLARVAQFRLIASSLTLQGCLRAAVPVLLAPVSAGAGLLLSAELAARVSSLALMLRGRLRGAAPLKLRIDWLALRGRLRSYWKYPLLLTPSALIDAAATMLPVPVLASFYGLEAAGKFALVQRLILLPAALIVGSVGDVFHAHAVQVAAARAGGVGAFLAGTARRLLLLALLVYLPVALVAPFVGRWLFGEQWSDAGSMMALLVPLCIAQTTVSPISRGLLLSGREERKLVADVVCLVLPMAALSAARSHSLLVAIGSFSAAATLAYAVYYLIIAQALKSSRAALASEQ